MRQQVTNAAGLLYVVTALVSGYWGLRVMAAVIPPPPWAQLTLFSAPILLLVGGVHTLFPQLRKKWLMAFTGSILLVLWASFFRGISVLYYLPLATAVTLISWAVLGLASTLRRPAIMAFVPSLILALCWIPVPIFKNIFSVIPPFARGVKVLLLNAPLLVVWILAVAASVLSGVATFKRSQA